MTEQLQKWPIKLKVCGGIEAICHAPWCPIEQLRAKKGEYLFRDGGVLAELSLPSARGQARHSAAGVEFMSDTARPPRCAALNPSRTKFCAHPHNHDGDHSWFPELTERQLELLAIIHAGWAAHRPPSMRELCAALGVVSTNGVNDLIQICIRKGFIQPREQGLARCLVLTGAGERAVSKAYQQGGALVQAVKPGETEPLGCALQNPGATGPRCGETAEPARMQRKPIGGSTAPTEVYVRPPAYAAVRPHPARDAGGAFARKP